jgi:sn-1 stearoyl-lipid 9-desaturase
MRLNLLTLSYLIAMHGLALSACLLPFQPRLWPVMLGVYLVGGLGTTVGYHRLISHRSFACPRWLEYVLVTMAMINTPGSPLLWVANHRSHHGKSDTEHDLHSPLFGFWYSHIGWICDDLSTEPQAYLKYCKDIADDRYYLWLLRFRMVPQVLAILAVAAIFGVSLLPQLFFLPTVLWMNSSFAVNSFCHAFGDQPYSARDQSRNFWPVGVLALGEGWHNNHHAFPHSARHGLRWWQLDISWLVIHGLQAVGLIWDLQLPTPAQLKARASERAPSPPLYVDLSHPAAQWSAHAHPPASPEPDQAP